jgi:hypothetical protein
LYGFQEVVVAFNDWLAKKLADETLYVIARKCVRTEFKTKLENYVSARIADSACQFDFQPITKLVDALLKRVGVNS